MVCSTAIFRGGAFAIGPGRRASLTAGLTVDILPDGRRSLPEFLPDREI